MQSSQCLGAAERDGAPGVRVFEGPGGDLDGGRCGGCSAVDFRQPGSGRQVLATRERHPVLPHRGGPAGTLRSIARSSSLALASHRTRLSRPSSSRRMTLLAHGRRHAFHIGRAEASEEEHDAQRK